MEWKTSKLTVALIVLLLLAASATTAMSQEDKGFDLNALAAKGEAIANADPLAAELRKQQPDDSARRGFDIGMAAAEGQTLPGPGKQKIGASLPPAEQRGFNIAVAFSLERNRNADLAVKGAAIAKADVRVAAARTAEDDVFYWLGFDIATGIFGDPALGAKGNTAVGPGSLKIRDSLSPAGQRGFNAAVKLHLGQDASPSSTPERRPRTSGEVTSIDNFGKRNAALDKAYGDFSKAGAAPSNEIRCRGGRNAFIFTAENSRASSTGETIITNLLTFEPAPQAAGVNGAGLKPGQCSWADRPMNERFLIRFETSANAQLRQQLHGTPLDTSPTAAERFPDAQTIPAYLNDPNHYWSFFGAKPAGNFFVATGHKYWKPTLSLEDGIRIPANPDRVGKSRYANISDKDKATIGERAPISSHLGSSVYGQIRWKKAYGLIPLGPAYNTAHPVPCGLFFVAAMTTEGAPGIFGNLTTLKVEPGQLNEPNKVPEEGDYYVCRYSISGLPANKIMLMIAGLGGSLLLPELDPDPFWHTTPWIGGSQPKPPPGYDRVFQGGGTVKLTQGQHLEINFEMVYAPVSKGPR